MFEHAAGALGKAGLEASINIDDQIPPSWITLSVTTAGGYGSSITFACERRGVLCHKHIAGPADPHGVDTSELSGYPAASLERADEKTLAFVRVVLAAN